MMAEVLKLGTTISFTTFEKISKLKYQERYLKWKCTMNKYLKIYRLWIWIVGKHEQPRKDDTGLEKSVKVHDLIYTILRIGIEENAYSNIKNITNDRTACIILETNFKPRRSR